jgi:asparagine synthase (glutamine-hydrolysing)
VSRQADTGGWICVADRGLGGRGLELRPEAGRPSPLIARTGAVTVVFDGHLANRHELFDSRDDFSVDDAGVILDAYRRLGDSFLSRVSGTFALVVWDADKDRLLCVRDPIGIHPLVYSACGGTLLMASSVEALLRPSSDASQVDPVATALSVLGLPLRLGETLFGAVESVPPGHVLEVTSGGLRVHRYWDPGEPGGEEDLTPREAATQFDALLSQAADRCLETGPIGVYLSGGIDSATVAAATAERSSARELPRPLGLALMVDHPDLDEEPNQRAIAADLDLELIPVSIDEAVGPGRLLRATLEASRSGTASAAGIIQPIYDFLARAALRRGREAIVNGQGGDEWLLPPQLYGADRLRALDLPALYRVVHAWYHYLPFRSHVSSARLLLWTWGARPLVRAAVHSARSAAMRDRRARRLLERMPAWLAPDAALRRALVERALAAEPELPPAELYRASRRELLDRPDRPGLTEEAFATQRRLGVRTLMPLLDADIVRFLYRLPPDLLVHGGCAKALARQVVARRLPSFGGGWPRTVSGHTFYPHLVQRELPLAWGDAGGMPCLAQLGVVDESKVARLVGTGASTSESASIWSATNLDVWLRSQLDGALEARGVS